MTKVVAVIQARTSSSRLPGKVLKPLCGVPMIVFMLRRLVNVKCVDEITVATSTDASDDRLATLVEQTGFRCYRGDLSDVLNRFYGAAKEFGGEIIVRLTGDCPLVDADLIDAVVNAMKSAGADYASNIDPPSYPDGLDVEAFTFESLLTAWREARLSSDREHVTPYLRSSKNMFKQASVNGLVNLSNLRWTVDYPDDFEFIESMLARIGVEKAVTADRFDFLRVLDSHPELLAINQHDRNEGYAKSLAQDQGAVK